MTQPETLNELEELKESGFGRPYPRHGLKLLYWFACDCVKVHGPAMYWKYDPRKKYFGFRLFKNQYESGGKLLPDVGLKYYEVGNVRKSGTGQYKLPPSVREDYNPKHHESNKDRVIFSVDGERIDRVYVTVHRPRRKGFDKEATYSVSAQLMMDIGNLDLEDFLVQAGYSQQEDQDLEVEWWPEQTGGEQMRYFRLRQEEDGRRPREVYEPENCCGCVIL